MKAKIVCIVILLIMSICVFTPAQVVEAGMWCDMAKIAGGYHVGLNLACALEFFMEIGLQYYLE